MIVDCGDESVEATTTRVMDAVLGWRAPRRLPVTLASTRYDVVIGDGLLARAGALLAPVLPQRALSSSPTRGGAAASVRRCWPA